MQDIELEQAIDLLLAHAAPVRETERVPLLDAVGRTAAEEVRAGLTILRLTVRRWTAIPLRRRARVLPRRSIPCACMSSARSVRVISLPEPSVRANVSAL